jgi:hypothetical protein
MLPAALELMHTVSLAVEARQQYTGVMVQPQAFAKKLFETGTALSDPSVLELQLLLLACQAKLRHQQLAATQQGCSLVHEMTQTSCRQQHQQPGVLQQLQLPAAHQDLLSQYALHEVDLAQLGQQQQQQQQQPPEQPCMAPAQYIRCVTTPTSLSSVPAMRQRLTAVLAAWLPSKHVLAGPGAGCWSW